MKVWIISEAPYYHDCTYMVSAHRTKSSAEKKCRNDGFLFNKRQGIFLNEKEMMYRHLEMISMEE